MTEPTKKLAALVARPGDTVVIQIPKDAEPPDVTALHDELRAAAGNTGVCFVLLGAEYEIQLRPAPETKLPPYRANRKPA